MLPLAPWRAEGKGFFGNWRPTVLSWLREEGSITARLRQTHPDLSVMVLHEGLLDIQADEHDRLGIEPITPCWVREVVLHHRDQRLVHARTVIPHWGSQNPWQQLQQLGQRPLGEVLFQLPDVTSSMLEFSAVAPVALGPFTTIQQASPARRRLHYRNNAALLLTEAFDFLAEEPPQPDHAERLSRVEPGGVLVA